MRSQLTEPPSVRMITTGAGNPPLVFVHGFACDGTDWRAQVAALRERTTVIECELPGHGTSRAVSSECTIKGYGAALALALTECALPPAVLVGHSMGCRVILEANRVRPEVVAGLVLVDGSRIGEGDPLVARRAMADELAGDGYERFVREFFDGMFFPGSDPGLARSILERALQLPAAVGRSLMTDLACWDAGEVEDALDAASVPVLAIQSTTMDTALKRVSLTPGLASPWLDLVRARIPGATIKVLPGSSHFPHIELADRVTALIAAFALADHR